MKPEGQAQRPGRTQVPPLLQGGTHTAAGGKGGWGKRLGSVRERVGVIHERGETGHRKAGRKMQEIVIQDSGKGAGRKIQERGT